MHVHVCTVLDIAELCICYPNSAVLPCGVIDKVGLSGGQDDQVHNICRQVLSKMVLATLTLLLIVATHANQG